MNKLDRVNRGKWWRMEHPDGCAAKFTVTRCGVRDKTPDKIEMRLEIYGPGRIESHIRINGMHCSLGEMRLEWDRLTKRGFVYNGD